jgi:hypothetical protein
MGTYLRPMGKLAARYKLVRGESAGTSNQRTSESAEGRNQLMALGEHADRPETALHAYTPQDTSR